MGAGLTDGGAAPDPFLAEESGVPPPQGASRSPTGPCARPAARADGLTRTSHNNWSLSASPPARGGFVLADADGWGFESLFDDLLIGIRMKIAF